MKKNSSKTNITLINYADKNFKKSQRINTKTALEIAGVTKVISYSPTDIDKKFYLNNKKILDAKRGNGYWLWKPYIIKKTLQKICWDDYVFYTDSGCYFIDSITRFTNLNQDIVPFELPYPEKMWTKRDAFIIMDCDSLRFTDSRQRLSGHILFKKTPFTMNFIEEWLYYNKDERVVTDQENVLGKPNYKDFRENRHDQSIFSLLTKKYNLRAYRDPSQWGNKDKEFYKATSDYPQIIVLTRKKNVPIMKRTKKMIKLLLSKFKIR